jgi:hypothetical protein
MEATQEDLDKIIRLTGAEDSSGLRMALAYALISIWDKGYNEGYSDAMDFVKPEKPKCPFTHSHTREWCGYPDCRES